MADSVYVIPGLNTNIWTTDPTLQIHYHPLAYFLNVHNGLTLDYQVSIEDLSDKTEYTVPFDSNYTFEVYHFNLKLLVFEDSTLIDSMAQFCISEIGLRIENDKVIINSDFTLRSFPNPFNSHLLIQYYLPFSQQIKISIYNSVGQELDVIENGYQLAGIHSKTWQAHNLSSGVYFIYLETSEKFR
jgi:hypothetical protein